MNADCSYDLYILSPQTSTSNDTDRFLITVRENTTFVEQYLVNHVYTLVVPPWCSPTTILIESANLTDGDFRWPHGFQMLNASSVLINWMPGNESTQGALAMVRMNEVDKEKSTESGKSSKLWYWVGSAIGVLVLGLLLSFVGLRSG
ncbi:unnamed protein product, partial [Mesorhabditis belari]|uniref:Uncharacterized protein n=1 Tax=Mesorhabditis belari TaxID=2138241 RepID=A0AAF3ENY6_9BILA